MTQSNELVDDFQAGNASKKHGKRWRVRFGLRTAIGVVLFAGSIFLLWVGPSLKQRTVAEDLRDQSIELQYGSVPDHVPQWLCDLLGKDFFCDLNTAIVDNSMSAASLRSLDTLKSLWDKNFVSSRYPLLPQLETLNIGHATPEFDCHCLRKFPALKTLIVSTKLVNGDAISQCAELRTLCLGNYAVSDSLPIDLTPAGNLQQLEILVVRGFTVNNLSPLTKLNTLETLELHRTGGADDLETLLQLSSLKKLTLKKHRFDVSEIKLLQDRLPDCEIVAQQDFGL